MTSDEIPSATPAATSPSNLPPELRPIVRPPAAASEPVMRDAVVMRDATLSEQDAANRAFVERNRSSMIKSMIITVGVFMAPFLALLFGLNAAIAVLVLALAFTTIVTIGGARRAGPSLRPKLYSSAILNGTITIFMALVLVLRLSS